MKSQVLSISDAMKLKPLCRGRLSVSNSAKNGKSFYCLQYRRKTKHVSKYIPADELEAYRAASGGLVP